MSKELQSKIKSIFKSEEIFASKFWWKNEWIDVFETKHLKGKFHVSIFLNDSEILSSYGMNLKKTVSVVSIIEPPFVYLQELSADGNVGTCGQDLKRCRVPFKDSNGSTWKDSCCYGYSVDLLLHLEKELRIKSHFYIVEDGKYGGYDRALHTYNGMIGDVIKKKADMAIAGLTITFDRSRFVDFSSPFMIAEIATIKLKEYGKVSSHSLGSFSLESLFCFLGFVAASYLFIYGIDNYATYRMRQVKNLYHYKDSISKYPWQECLLYLFSLIFQRDIGGKVPKSMGGRTIAIYCAFGMVTLTTLYTASLTADQVSKNKDVFLGLKDPKMMYPMDDFTFGTVADTSLEDFFRLSKDVTLNRMSQFMKNYNTKTLNEGMEKVKNGELDAFICESPFLLYYIAKDAQCRLQMFGNQVGQNSFGIAVGKNSTLKNILSGVIQDLRLNKVLADLEKKWLFSKCMEGMTPKQFSLQFMANPSYILASSIGVCFLILLLEWVIWKYQMKRKKCSTTKGDKDITMEIQNK